MDKLIKGLIADGHARVYLAYTTDLVEEARKHHDLWPTATAALGRTLSIATVMGGMLKGEDEKLTIQINGGGEIGTIMVDAFPNGKVRGFVSEPHVMLVNEKTHKLDVGKAVGTNGYLRVIRDISLKDYSLLVGKMTIYAFAAVYSGGTDEVMKNADRLIAVEDV